MLQKNKNRQETYFQYGSKMRAPLKQSLNVAHVVALTSLGRKTGHYLLTSVSNCYLQFLLTFPHPVFKTQHFVTCFPLLPHTFTKISNGNLIVKYLDRRGKNELVEQFRQEQEVIRSWVRCEGYIYITETRKILFKIGGDAMYILCNFD